MTACDASKFRACPYVFFVSDMRNCVCEAQKVCMCSKSPMHSVFSRTKNSWNAEDTLLFKGWLVGGQVWEVWLLLLSPISSCFCMTEFNIDIVKENCSLHIRLWKFLGITVQWCIFNEDASLSRVTSEKHRDPCSYTRLYAFNARKLELMDDLTSRHADMTSQDLIAVACRNSSTHPRNHAHTHTHTHGPGALNLSVVELKELNWSLKSLNSGPSTQHRPSLLID